MLTSEGLPAEERFTVDSQMGKLTLAPMTSVVKWVRYDGRPETQIKIGHDKDFLLCSPSGEVCVANLRYSATNKLWDDLIDFSWAYLPQPPEA